MLKSRKSKVIFSKYCFLSRINGHHHAWRLLSMTHAPARRSRLFSESGARQQRAAELAYAESPVENTSAARPPTGSQFINSFFDGIFDGAIAQGHVLGHAQGPRRLERRSDQHDVPAAALEPQERTPVAPEGGAALELRHRREEQLPGAGRGRLE